MRIGDFLPAFYPDVNGGKKMSPLDYSVVPGGGIEPP